MKNIIAVSLLALLFTAEVQAEQAPQYRAKFQAGADVCWAGGVDYPYGVLGSWSSISTNQTVTVYPGHTSLSNGYIILDIKPTCCGENLMLGVTWAEVSYDGGITWAMLTPTYRPLVMPGGEEAEFDCTPYGPLDGGHVRVDCTDGGGTGGQ